MKKILFRVVFSSLCVASFQNVYASDKNGASNNIESKKETSDSGPKGTLNKWFALGSGCKATPENPGDVRIERITPELDSGNIHRVKFHLPNFQFSFTEKDKEKKPGMNSARECALRINVNPPKNKRVKNVTASLSFVSNKSEKVELTTYAGLKIGVSNIGTVMTKYEMGNPLSNKQEDIILTPGKKPEEAFPSLQCGEAKILGVDVTVLAKRDGIDEKALVTLSRDKKVELVVDLEDCKN